MCTVLREDYTFSPYVCMYVYMYTPQDFHCSAFDPANGRSQRNVIFYTHIIPIGSLNDSFGCRELTTFYRVRHVYIPQAETPHREARHYGFCGHCIVYHRRSVHVIIVIRYNIIIQIYR